MRISLTVIFLSLFVFNYNILSANEMGNISIDDKVNTIVTDNESDNYNESDSDSDSDSDTDIGHHISDTFYGYQCVVVDIDNKSVCVGIYEVSQDMWKKVMKSNPAHFKNNTDNPVENVTMTDVTNFINKFNKLSGLKYRLLTYDEWSAVAEDDIELLTTLEPAEICSRFNLYDKSSDKLNRFGNKPYPCDDKFAYTAPVNTFQPNNLGIYNLIGNVAEWTSSLSSKGHRFVAGWSFSDSNIKVDKPDSRSLQNRFGGLGFRLAFDVEIDTD